MGIKMTYIGLWHILPKMSKRADIFKNIKNNIHCCAILDQITLSWVSKNYLIWTYCPSRAAILYNWSTHFFFFEGCQAKLYTYWTVENLPSNFQTNFFWKIYEVLESDKNICSPNMNSCSVFSKIMNIISAIISKYLFPNTLPNGQFV